MYRRAPNASKAMLIRDVVYANVLLTIAQFMFCVLYDAMIQVFSCVYFCYPVIWVFIRVCLEKFYLSTCFSF